MMQNLLHPTKPFPIWTKVTYVRMLFIDYCSAFNNIVLTKLITKDPGTKHLRSETGSW